MLACFLMMPGVSGQDLNKTYEKAVKNTGGGIFANEVTSLLRGKKNRTGKLNVAEAADLLTSKDYIIWLASGMMDDPEAGKVQDYIWIRKTPSPKIGELVIRVNLKRGDVFYDGSQYIHNNNLSAYERRRLWRDDDFPPLWRTKDGKNLEFPRKDIFTEQAATDIVEGYWINKRKWLKLHRYRNGDEVTVVFIQPLHYDMRAKVRFQVTDQGLNLYRVEEGQFGEAGIGFRRDHPDSPEEVEHRLEVLRKQLTRYFLPGFRKNYHGKELHMPVVKLH